MPSRRMSSAIHVRLSTTALSVMSLSVVLQALSGGSWLGIVADASLAAYLILEARSLPGLGKFVAVLALVLAGIVLWRYPDGLAVVLLGFSRATAVAAMLASMGFVVDAARSSPLIRRVGHALITQPANRRYAVTTIGAQLLSLVLNVGAISLLGAMIRHSNTLANAGGDPRQVEARTREAALASVRGVNAMAVWSPLSIGFSVTLSSVHGIAWTQLLPQAMLVAASLMLLGYLLDGLHLFAPARRHLSQTSQQKPHSDLQAWQRFGVLIVAILGSALAASQLLRIPLSVAVALVVPPIGVLWMAAQYRRAGAATAFRLTGRRLAERLPTLFPGVRTEICLLCSGTLIGATVGRLLDPRVMESLISHAGLTPLLLAALMLVAIMASAQLGIGAIVGISVFGAALPDPSVIGMTPMALATLFVSAWGLSAGFAAYGTTVLVAARTLGASPTDVAFRWNGPFTLAGCVVALGWWALVNA